jgi:thioredoxin 2
MGGRVRLAFMIVPCPSCSAKNRIPPRKLDEKPKCGKCKQVLSPPATPVIIETGYDLNLLMEDTTLPVLVDFWAQWCAPCRAVAPELVKLAKKKAGSLIVAKVDTDAMPQVASRFNIKSIPTFILFKNGDEDGRVTGAASGATIIERLGL